MSIWPVEGGPERWPVYRGSAAHVAAGQGPGCDLGNQLGLPWIAVGDGGLHSYGYESADAGWFADLHFTLGGYGWQLRYCHGLEQPHPETDNTWDTAANTTARWPVKRGDVIGHVGYSGNVNPAGPAGAHLHNACWRDGVRVEPEVLYALLQEEEPVPAPEWTPEEKVAITQALNTVWGWSVDLVKPGSMVAKVEAQAGGEMMQAVHILKETLGMNQ